MAKIHTYRKDYVKKNIEDDFIFHITNSIRFKPVSTIVLWEEVRKTAVCNIDYAENSKTFFNKKLTLCNAYINVFRFTL